MSELQLQEYAQENPPETVPASRILEQPIGTSWDLPSVTIEVFQAPVNQVLSEVASQLAVSVLVPQESYDRTITVQYQSADGQKVVEDIAEYLGLVAEFDGQTLRFVASDRAIQDFVVVRSGYKSPSDLVVDLQSLLNTGVRVRAVDDRVVVAGTRRDLEQVVKLERHLQTGPDGWVLNVRIVGVTESFRRDLGLDWDLGGSFGFTASDLSATLSSQIAVRVIAEATQDQADAFLAYQATVHVLEGTTATVTQGRRVPVPRYQTSPEGTTTTVGYDYIDAGFKLDVSAQRVPVGVRLQMSPSISSVTGFVGDAPITEQSSVKSDVVVHDGQWIIITGLSTEQLSSDSGGVPGIPAMFGHESRLRDKSSLLVLVQANRVFTTEPDQRP